MDDFIAKAGHFNQAEEFENQVLEDAKRSDEDRGRIYHQLHWLKVDRGEYQETIRFYETSPKIKLKIVPDDDISLCLIYSGIREVYDSISDVSMSLKVNEKSG